MADNNLKFDDVDTGVVGAFVLTPELVKKYFSVAKNLVALAKNLVKFSSTKFDDLINWVDVVLDSIEPYLSEQWAYELINGVINLFQKKGVEEAVKFLEDAAPAFVVK